MYTFSMEKNTLRTILSQYYSTPSINKILKGDRRPRYEIILELHRKHKIPFDVWIDIKSFINNDTKKKGVKATTNRQKNIGEKQ